MFRNGQDGSGMLRKIIHVDMDAFFAAVEQRDNPGLKGRPVVVGGDPDKRGVVATCSYEARRYGIHSAMPVRTACRLCPHAVFLRPRFDAYKDASAKVFAIFKDYADLVESMSIDEAYLDVTNNRYGIGSATVLAREIQRRIYDETSLTASAGVSYNMFLAKAASDYQKPRGLTVVTPGKALLFIEALPIGKFHGIGRVTEDKMRSLSIHNGKDLRQKKREFLVKHFGKAGACFYDIARGVDNREVNPVHIRKSVGKEVTLDSDSDDLETMMSILSSLVSKVSSHLVQSSLMCRTITLKIRYDDFESITRSITISHAVCEHDIIFKHIRRLLSETEAGIRKVRLLGLAVSNLNPEGDGSEGQLSLPFTIV